MARPSRCRRICWEPDYKSFVPDGTACGRVVLTVDEYEAIRLVDLEKLTHEQCARQMDISRTTVTEIYESARRKIADSIINGKVLVISGGNYRICDGSAGCHRQKTCRKVQMSRKQEGIFWERKGADTMRIAVTYENGNIFQHFGHTEQFKIYDVTDNTIEKETVVDTNGSGHGALAGFLADQKVDALICGGIGGGARDALAAAGIALYGGVSGEADAAVKALVEGNLEYNPDTLCSHHDHGHHGHGQCGEDHQGCHGHNCGE